MVDLIPGVDKFSSDPLVTQQSSNAWGRAELSTAMNPRCRTKQAKAAVDEVFEQCFRDTRPYDDIP